MVKAVLTRRRAQTVAAKAAGALVVLAVGVTGVLGGAPLAYAEVSPQTEAPESGVVEPTNPTNPTTDSDTDPAGEQADGPVTEPTAPPTTPPLPSTTPEQPVPVPVPEATDLAEEQPAPGEGETGLVPLTPEQQVNAVQAAPRSFVGSDQVSCIAFSDVTPQQKFAREIEWMQRSKLTTGTKNASGVQFQPKTQLSREAMAAFLFRKHARPGWQPSARSPFRDVSRGHKFYREILWMHETGLTKGNRTPRGLEYQPKATVSREAMAAFFYRQYAQGYKAPAKTRFVDVPRGHKFYREISWMRDAKISTGVNTTRGRAYEPQAGLSREALAAFMYRQAGSPKVAQNCLTRWANSTFGTFAKKKITGHGDQVVRLPGTAGVVTIKYRGNSLFYLSTLDNTNSIQEFLASSYGNYSGTVPFGLEQPVSSKRIQVNAEGPWELEFRPVSSANRFKTSGTGDAVMLHTGPPRDLQLTHQNGSLFMVLVSAGGYQNWDILTSSYGSSYRGTVASPAGPLVYTIRADGKWTAKLK